MTSVMVRYGIHNTGAGLCFLVYAFSAVRILMMTGRISLQGKWSRRQFRRLERGIRSREIDRGGQGIGDAERRLLGRCVGDYMCWNEAVEVVCPTLGELGRSGDFQHFWNKIGENCTNITRSLVRQEKRFG